MTTPDQDAPIVTLPRVSVMGIGAQAAYLFVRYIYIFLPLTVISLVDVFE